MQNYNKYSFFLKRLLSESSKIDFRKESSFLKFTSVFSRWVFAVLLLLFLNGCSTKRFLSENEYLVSKNEVILETKIAGKEKAKLKSDLASLIEQKPNSKFLRTSRAWFYFWAKKGKKETSFDRFILKAIAEEPVIYNDSIAQKSSGAMKYYMNYNGFFRADSDYSIKKTNKKKVKVTYVAKTENAFKIDSIFYNSPIEELSNDIQKSRRKTLIKSGRQVDLDQMEEEKKRISTYLRNNGYAFFYPIYFDKIDIDTFQTTGKANLYFEILPSDELRPYSTYSIGEVNIFTDYSPEKELSAYQDTVIENYHFYMPKQGSLVKPKALLRTLKIASGDLYNQEKIDDTNNRLSQLGVYRFVRLRQEISTSDTSKIDIRIELTPQPKMELGIDFQINYANRNAPTGAGTLFGFSVSPSYQNRNLFGGAELFTINLGAGAEFNLDTKQNFLNTLNLSTQTSLSLPNFLDYLGFWKGLYKIPWKEDGHVLNTQFYNSLQRSPTTISLGFNYSEILNQYTYRVFNAAYGYKVQANPRRRYLLNHIGIEFVNPSIEPDFQRILDDNPFLQRSFTQQVFFSLLFKNFDLIYNSPVNRKGRSWLGQLSTELAGFEIWGVNAIYNEFALDSKIFKLGETIEFSQYLKVDADLRRYIKPTSSSEIALRANIGIIKPFGYSDVSPYVKQFFVGGANSIRAWNARGLGPGGYLDTLSLNNENRNLLYQTGDIKMEFNAEYRFDIFWYIKGAFFIDAGNVWTSNYDDTRCGSQFLFKSKQLSQCADNELKWNDPFYKQMAVGGGFGLRFDLSYFLFRLDMAVKIRNPYPEYFDENGKGHNYMYDFGKFGINDIGFRIGLGYPF